MYTNLVSLFILFAFLLTIYIKRKLSYWEKLKVPYLNPKIPFGNLENPFAIKISVSVQFGKLYHEFKQLGVKYGGIYTFLSPVFVPVDPEYVKYILTKNFSSFYNRGFYSNEAHQPMSGNLFTLDDSRWRNMRNKMTPTFTSGKMKNMYHIIRQSSLSIKNVLAKSATSGEPINIKDVAACYLADSIGSCAFGLECNSFEDRKYLDIVEHSVNNNLTPIKDVFCFSFQSLARRLGVVPFPRVTEKFFTDLVNETVTYRETNNVRRSDFIQMLIDLKNATPVEGENGETFTTNHIVAQTFLFFVAGLHTSSNALAFCFLELTQNTSIQEKVRREINEVLQKYDGEATYEAIMEMKYMQQVIDGRSTILYYFAETLRKYPIVAVLHRKCTQEFPIPGTDVVIEKGTNVVIPVLGIHRDPQIYPNPDKFDPERFSEENKQHRHPYAYIPFGEGPRSCAGLRFALLQIKVALTLMLKNFSFTVNPKTRLPIKFAPVLMLESVQDILLDVRKV